MSVYLRVCVGICLCLCGCVCVYARVDGASSEDASLGFVRSCGSVWNKLPRLSVWDRIHAIWGVGLGLGSRGLGLGLEQDSRTTPPRAPLSSSPSSLLFAARTLVRGGPTRPHRPRLVASHSTRPPSSPPLPAHSFYIGPAVINNNPRIVVPRCLEWSVRKRKGPA